MLTGSRSMTNYAIEISQQHDLLGKTVADKIKIDCYRAKGLEDHILSFLCSGRFSGTNSNDTTMEMKNIKVKKISSLLKQYEKECCVDHFFLGYLTIMDFTFYEIINYCELLFPKVCESYPRLVKLRDLVAEIPEIKDYEASDRVVLEYCPIRYFNTFKN